MKGFFELTPDQKTQSLPRRANRAARIEVAPGYPLCDNCGLYGGCNSPRMQPTGRGEKGVLCIAEAPDQTEDETLRNRRTAYGDIRRQGLPLIGKAGNKFREFLPPGVNLDRDCWLINAVNCRPPGNRTPSTREIAACRPMVLKAIKELRPNKIILLGRVALESFLGHRTDKLGALGRWLGAAIPDQDVNAWVFPTNHPSYILRLQGSDPVVDRLFREDLERAFSWDKPFPYSDRPETGVHVLSTPEEAKNYLQCLNADCSLAAFDWECSGLKPYRDGHFIYTGAIATSSDSATAFPIFEDESFRAELYSFLINPRIEKIAHNAKFEDVWTRVIFGRQIRGWKWCSMIASHILRTLKGTTGLKFLAYLRYGILGYDDEISHFLKAPDPNSFNQIKKAPLNKVLKYNGVDAFLTYRLALEQMREMETQGLMDSYRLFHDGWMEFSLSESEGFNADLEYFQTQNTHLERRISRIQEKIKADRDVVNWENVYKKTFNPNSAIDLKSFCYDFLRLPILKKTKKNNPSLDEEALTQMEGYSPAIDLVLQLRKLDKIRGTYLEGLIRETTDGVIHGNQNLHIAESLRPSMDNPNLQNVPKRDEEANRIVRSGFIAPGDDWIIVEVDYSGVEVCGSACYHHDPAMIKYIEDKTTDMHRDTAMELFFLELPFFQDYPKTAWKPVRHSAKNNYVFPEFYGSYYGQVAPNLWKFVEAYSTNLPTYKWETVSICSQDILDVWNTTNGREKFPDLYDFIARADKAQKIAYIQTAMNGLVPPALKRFDKVTKVVSKAKTETFNLREHLSSQGIKTYKDWENHVRQVEDRFWNERFKVYQAWKEENYARYLKNGFVEMLTGFRRQGPLSKNQANNTPIQGTAFHLLLWSYIQVARRMRAAKLRSKIMLQIHDSMIMKVYLPELEWITKTVPQIMTKEIREYWDWICVPLEVEIEVSRPGGNWGEMEEVNKALKLGWLDKK